MDQEEFEERMQRIDSELIKKSISLKARPLESLNTFYPNSSFSISPEHKIFFGEFEGPNLFEKIQFWYGNRYSQKMLSNFRIGKKPFKLRGEIYYIEYPVVCGQMLSIDILGCVEDLTIDMRCSLTTVEQKQILEEFELGYEAFNEIQGLDHLIEQLRDDATDLLLRGMVDVEAAASLVIDIQNTIFHSHQAAEKFLKALLVELEYQHIIKKYRTIDNALLSFKHSLLKIYNKLPVEKLPHKKVIYSQVKYLHNLMPTMDVRYKNIGKTLEEAVCSINSMLKICKFVSEQITFIHVCKH
jgi:HEPN domain-containing protein